MKALTLTQPWATLVAIGAKRVETRSFQTHYRGPLAIHAAKGFPRYARDVANPEARNLRRLPSGERQTSGPNVANHTFQRLDSFVDAIVGKRLTYARLIAKVPA